MTDKGVIVDHNVLPQLHASGAFKVWRVLLNGPILGTKPHNIYDDVDLIVMLGLSQYVQGPLPNPGWSGEVWTRVTGDLTLFVPFSVNNGQKGFGKH